MDERECPECEGRGVYMGTLGDRKWYRCRDCGVEFSVKVESEDE